MAGNGVRPIQERLRPLTPKPPNFSASDSDNAQGKAQGLKNRLNLIR
jgi:hypothetical protein